MELEKYEKMFMDRMLRVKVSGLCGRILCGRKLKDFDTLTYDPNRLVIMLIGSDGLEYLLGKSGYESLIHIGYTKDYIQYKMDQGNKFKLVVFKENESILLATWDNVAKLCSNIYPDVSDKIYAVLHQLKSTPFRRIQMLVNFDFEQTKRNGLVDPNYMDYERFRESEGTLVDVRAFLYHTLHFRVMFSGDGYTYDEDGNRGLMEYIAPNKRLDELGEYRLIDMEIEI
ncbi:MAG: hypothetical protein ACFFD2_08020 [Promethearchaeota archaeon]